jgi:hypothetical protein
VVTGWLVRCGDGLDLQHRVLVQPQLGFISKHQGHAGSLAGAHKVSA